MELPDKLDTFMKRDRNINYITKSVFKYEEYKNGKYSSDASWFDIKSYWIPKDDIDYFFINTELKDIFIQDEKFLFLVHPESEKFYTEFTENKEPGKIFKGLATSSQRTVLTFVGNIYFFVKLSLDLFIGGTNRNIGKKEIVRSIGTTKFLRNIKTPNMFEYFPEVISAIPKNFERGGMIVREIPDFMYKYDIFPIFSVFTKNENGIYILKYDYLKWIDNLIYLFIKQYLELCSMGITTQSHSQNLLLALDGDKILFFIYRDFGGFSIDLKYIEKKYGKIELPYITGLDNDYMQKSHLIRLRRCISDYFRDGMLYSLCESLNVPFNEKEQKIKIYMRYILLTVYKLRIGEIDENYEIMNYIHKKIRK